ncbi:hypothetical protein AKJ50_02510 [candidate division MSBL1 archaeon SCGC-AAA382A13]|uniref:Cupin 2 conserved barrel domain-containing protein n=1 Tax=candidate division MSBL1 archaeon SCGC-AAA382A13 TaxID=1698279 RepID=A0A133VD36_9EURY|nr:hypothetical protein AKJ50_02510 [candidate division MSBL1 archaeon SCGC-AAA382A13]
MTDENTEKPEVFSVDDWDSKSREDYLVPDCTYVPAKDVDEVWGIGFYFIPPGVMTNTFSMEEEDDDTADEYYGPCHEFYFVITGKLTMYWGKDDEKIKNEKSEKLELESGEIGYWTPGWKYAVKNTGNVPATFFWGITRPPEELETKRNIIFSLSFFLLKQYLRK